MLNVEQLQKAFGEKVLFNDLTFTIPSHARIGLVGVNGTGKSTLLQIIAGIEPPDSGQVISPKDYQIAYLEQNPIFEKAQTVLDHIFAGDSDLMRTMREYESILAKLEIQPENEKVQTALIKQQQEMDKHEAWDANAKAKTILTKLGVTRFDAMVTDLSGGQKKRVAIARALIQPVDLLILDEPTNHLDNNVITWLEKYLQDYEGSLLFVTHDRYFLNRVANRLFELDHGHLYEYEGNYEVYLEKKVEREALEKHLEAKHKNRLRNELAWLQRGARARSTKQRARKERIDDMKEETFQTKKEQVDMQVSASRLGKQVIELTDVSKRFGEEILFENFNLLVTPGDRIGIIGPNGVGKSTLLQIISQRLQPDQGVVSIGETVKFAYYTQGESELDDDLRIIEYIKKTAQIIETKAGDTITAEQMLEKFLFSRAKQWTKISRLSGGEKRRLYLLKVLMTAPNVILLDEPTNDLDVETLGILEDYLEKFPGVVITVSHDRYFLDVVVDKLLVFSESASIELFYGNYSDYEVKGATAIAEEKAVAKETAKKVNQDKPKTKKKLSYHEQKEWETIEDEIGNIEEEIETKKKEIVEAGSDFEAIQKLYEAQESLEETLLEKMERWETLSDLVEGYES